MKKILVCICLLVGLSVLSPTSWVQNAEAVESKEVDAWGVPANSKSKGVWLDDLEGYSAAHKKSTGSNLMFYVKILGAVAVIYGIWFWFKRKMDE